MMKHLRAHRLSIGSLMALLVLLWQIATPISSQAATLYWDGSSSGSWNTIANWSTVVGGGADPAAVAGAVDDVIFNATAVTSQIATLDAAQSVRSLTFSSNATTAITLAAGTSGSLALGSGGITLEPGSAAVTISAPMSLTAAQTWTNDSANLLTVSGAITGYSATNTLTLGGSGNMTISGLTAAVSTTITKNGTGTVTIGGADPNFTGTVVVNAGVLDFSTATNDFTVATVNNGGTLRARATSVLSDSLVMTINSGGIYDIQATDTIAAILGTGTVSAGVTTTLTVSNTTNRQFDGVLANGAGVLGFSKSGTNTVTLTNNSTYTGTTTVNTGNLTLSGAGGKLSGSTTINIGDFNGAGDTLTLGASTDVVSGALDRLSDSASVAVRGGGVLAINGPASGSGGFEETILNLTTDSGFNTVTLTPASGQQLRLSVTDILRSANAATSGVFLFRGTNLGGSGADSSRIIASIPTFGQIGGGGAGGATNISILPWAVGDTSATGVGGSFVTHNGTDGIRPLTNAEYVATIAGQASTNNASTAGGETLTADATVNALRLTGGTTTLTGSNTQINITSGALLVTDAATTAGTGSLNFGTAEGIVTLANATGVTASLNARMTGSGNVTFSGSGSASNIIDLGGDNFFAGTLKINNGAIVRVSNAGALNNDAINTVQIQTGGVLRLNGNSTVIRNLASTVSGTTYALTGNVVENVSSTNATLRVFSNADTNFRGILQNGTGTGTLSLIKSGGNTLTLHAANTLTGSVQVNGGTLSLDTNGGGTFTAITDLIIASGGTVSVAFGTSNTANRIPDALAVKMQGGSFTMASGSTGASRSETVGALTLQAGANTITGGQAASTFASTLTFASLATPTAGATVNFAGTSLGADLRNRITFTTYPTLDDNIFGGFATVGNEWATRSADLGTSQFSVVGLATYTTSLSTGANPAQNVKITASASLTASSGLSTINSLNLAQAGATTVTIGAGNTLRVESGGILTSGAFAPAISAGTLTAGTGTDAAGNLYLHANHSGTGNNFVISSVIANNGTGAVTLTKTGTGQVNLTGTNTYTGMTSINAGVLQIVGDAQLGTAPGTATAGHLKIYGGTLKFDGTADATLNANRGLEIGGATATIDGRSSSTTLRTYVYNGRIVGTADAGLQVQGNVDITTDTLNVGGSLVLQGTGNTTDTSTLTLTGASHAIGGGLVIGTPGTAADATGTGRATLNYAVGSGTLNVGANLAGDNLDIGVRTSTDSLATVGVLNLGGAANFSASVDNFRVGVVTNGTGSGVSTGTVTLAANNFIYAGTQVLLGDTAGGTAGNAGVLNLGAANTIVTPLMTVGGRRSSTVSTVSFLAPSSALTLLSPSGATELRISFNNLGNSSNSFGTMDLSNGSLTADLSTLTIGLKGLGNDSLPGGSTGTLTLGSGANNVTAGSVILGQMINASGTIVAGSMASGTLSMAGGTFATTGDVSMGLWQDNSGTDGTARGTLTLTGGTFSVGGNIVKSTNTTTRSAAMIEVNGSGATLDLTNGTINASQLAFRQGTISNVVSATLDGSGVTSGIAFAALTDALVLRDVTVNFPLVLSSATASTGGILYESAGGGSGAVISGTLDVGSVARTINVQDNVSAANDLTISGQISGSGDVTKSGTGTLVFSNGSNNYTGKTLVTAGTLSVSADGHLGAVPGSLVADQLTLSSGATLAVTDTFSTSANRGVTLGTGGGQINVAATKTLTVSAAIAGTGNSLTKNGSGSLVLSGTNAYTGATVVNAGKLLVNGALDAGSAVSVAGLATLGGSGTVNGLTTVSNTGVIEAGYLQSGSLNLAGGVVFGSGATDTATINLANVFGGSPSILNAGALTINSGAATITINIANSGSVNNATYTLFDYTGSIGGTGAGYGAFVKGTIGGLGGRQNAALVDDVTNSLVALTISGDSPKWTGFDATASANSSVWHPGNATLLNWQLISAATATDFRSGDQVLFDDSATGSYVVDISNGNVDPVSVEFNNSNGVGKTYTLQGSNGITGSTGLTKNNTGTLIINNANSFTGGVVINGGVIQLGNVNALGTGNLLTFGAAAPAGTKLQLNGNNATVTGLVSAGVNAVVENGTSASTNATLTVNLASGSNTFAGVLQNGGTDTLGLSQTGAGTLILTGANTYTGGTSVGAGSTLQVGAGGAVGSLALNGNATVNGTLRFNRTGTVAYGGTVGGTGSLSIVAGTLEFTGTVNNTLVGTSISSGATLQIGNGTTGGTVSSNIANAGALVINLPAAGSTVLSGNITGAGSLTTTGGNGTTILTGANTYNGATTIGTGTILQVGNGGTTGTVGTAAVINNGTLRFARTGSYSSTTSISGSGGVEVTNGGALTFGGTNTYNGSTSIRDGTLRLSAASALSASTSLVLGDTGTTGTLDLNGINATVGGISTGGTAASQIITNNNATTNATLTVSLAGSSAFNGQLRNGPARSLGLAITGGGTLTLGGNSNNYSLGTTITNGTAKLGADNAFGAGGITLGGTGTVGVLDLNGFNQTVTALAVGAGATAASQLIGNGGSGTSTLEFAASGASTFAGTIQDNFGGSGITALTITSNSLTLTGGATHTGNTSIAAAGTLVMQQATNQNFSSNLSGGGIFTQNGAAILTLNGTNSMTGITRITGGGTLKAGVASALSANSSLVIGNGTASGGNLDLGSTSQTILAMTINPNATTANTNTITIASGQKLTVNGSFSIDSNTDNAITTVNMTGGGQFEVNGTSFTVGNNTTGTNNSSRATLNMADLSSFTANLTGTFAVMLTGDNDAAHVSTVILSNTANSITANTFGVGVSSTGAAQVLTIGAGTNVINANTVNFGTGGRDSANVSFGSNLTGTLTVRNAAGSGRAAMNIGTGSATTGFASTNTVDFAGHNADLLLSTFTLGNQFRNGAQTNTFTFDQGTFDATTVRVGLLPAAGGTQASATLASSLNWNGGTVVIGNGGLELANSVAGNTVTDKTLNAVVNINGAAVTIANSPTLGAAIRLFNNTGASTINNISGLVNITAGSLTVSGDVVRGVAAAGGTHSATLTLNGGVLNMGGNNIGSGSLAVTFNAQSGTLSNLNELNGGATLDKTTAGTLILNTANSYAGATTVSGGVLAISHGNALGGTANGTTVATGTALQISGGITTAAEALTLSGTGVSSAGAFRNTSGNNNYTGAITLGAASRINSDAGTLTLSGGITGAQDLTFGGAGQTTVSSVIGTSTGTLTKDGGGSLILSAVNTYTGATAVNAGKLFINGSLDAASAVTVAGGATLGGTGALPGTVTVNSGGIIEAGHLGAGDLTIGTLNLGTVATDTSIINLSNIATGTPGLLDLTTLNVLTNPATITINISNATAVATGTYKLIDYTGTALTTPQFNAFTLGTTTGFNSRQVLSLFNNTTLTQIELTMTGDAPKWTGFDATASANSSVWHPGNNTLLNWQLIGLGTPTDYQTGDQVLFDDSATGSYVVDISNGNVDPASVVFNNSNGVGKTYTLQGSNGITGSTGLTKNNTGTLIINNANSFTGGVVINGGVIQLGNANALGTGNLLTFGAAAPAGTKLQLNGNNATVTGLVSAGVNAVVENGTSASTNATLTVNLASGSNTFAGVLQNSGGTDTLGLSQTGAGTLILTGTNTYTGGTSVGAGSTLQVGAGGASGSILGNATVNGTLRFNRTGTVAYGGTVGGTGSLSIVAGTLEFTGTVNNTLAGTSISSGATLQIGNGTTGGTVSSSIANAGALVINLPAAGSTVLSGNITGAGSLTTTGGNGTTILTGANTYNGATTIGTGTILQVGNGGTTGALGTGTVTIDGTLRFSRTDALVVSAPLGGGGGVNIASGSITYTGANTYTGDTTVDSGTTLSIGLGGILGSVAGNIVANGSVTFNRGDAITYAGVISGAGSITKSGNGVTTFTGSNSYSGTTTINGGTLSISASNNLGNAAITNTISISNGAILQNTGATVGLGSTRTVAIGTGGAVLDVTGTNVLAVAGVVSGGALLTKTGTGVLTLSGNNTHSAGTTLSGGTLNINHAAAIGSGLFTIAGGTTIDNTSLAAITLSNNNVQAWNGDFTFTGTNDLNLGLGAVTLSANRAVTVSGGTLTVGGIIDDGASNFTFTKNGAGTLYLTGVNTFGSNSAVTISGGGVLKIDAESGLGTNTNDVTFGTGGGTLYVTNGFVANAGKVFNVQAGPGTIQVDSGTLVIGSAIVGTAAATANGGGLIKTGAGTLALTIASTAYDAQGVAAAGSGATGVGFRVDAGTLLLQGTSTSVVGDINPNSMTIQLNGGNLTIQTDTASIARANLWVSSDATLTTDRATAGSSLTQNIGTGTGAQLTIGNTGAGAAVTLNVAGGSNYTSGVATVGFGATTLNRSATFNITDSSGGGTTLLSLGAVTGGANSITLTGNGDFAQTGVFASTAASSLTLNSGYSGIATLSQANTYTGATTINGGTLAFSTSANLGDATQTTNTLSIDGGTLSYTGAGSLDIGVNRVVTVGSSGATLNATGAAGILTISGGITSTGNLTKTGIGSVIVSGTTSVNSGTGTVTVNGGLLAAGFGTGGVDNITVAAGAALYNTDSSATTLLLPSAGSLTLTAGTAVGTASKLGFGMNGTSAAAISLDATTPLTINSTSAGDTIYIDLVSLGTALTEKDYHLIIDTATLGRLLTGTGGAITYALDNVIGGYVYTLSATANLVKVNVSSFNGSLYWHGDLTGPAGSWTDYRSNDTNWRNALTGGTDLGVTPGTQTTVVFSATEATGPTIATTLDGNVSIKNLQFTSNPSGVSSVTIASGTFGSLTIGNALGIDVAANAGAIAISAPIILGASQTWSVDGTGGASLTVSGGVSGTAGLTILGTNSGIVTLSGTNLATYSGTTTVGSATASSGILQAGAATSFSATSAHTINAGGTLRLNGFNNTIGSLAGAGTVHNNTATNATLTTGGDNSSTTFSGTLANGSTGTLGLTKLGTGTLTLSGSNSYTGTTTVTAGILRIQGSTNTGVGTTTLGNAAAARARLQVASGGAFTTTDLFTGGNATGAGAVYQSAGSVTTSAADGTNRGLVLGQTSTGYGFYDHGGGTLTTARITYGANGQTGGTGVFRLSGGTATVNTWNVLAHGTNSNAMLDILSGAMTSNSNFAANHGSGGYSLINIRGGQLTVNTTTQINRGNNSTSNNTGILTLAGGILATNTVSSAPTQTPTGGNVSVVNFNGGTLRALQANSTFVNINTTGHDAARTGAFVHSGGATIDSNGFAIIIASALQAPSGVGVQSIAVTDGGSGYIGPPVIKITGGSGSGAVAIANMEDDGTGNGTFKIGSITILSPGSGYLNTDVLTVAAAGGGATTAATLGALAFNASQTSGGLTKTGAGTLTLTGTNTYTGSTTISAGTLQVGNGTDAGSIGTTSSISNSGALVYNVGNGTRTLGAVISGNGTLTQNSAGGTLILTGTNIYTGSTTISAGTLQVGNGTDAGSIGTTSSISNSGALVYNVGAGTRTLGAVISGTGTLTQNSAGGTLILTGTNTYTGLTTISNGALQIASEANLGATPASFVNNQLTLGGGSTTGTLKTTGDMSLSANRGVSLAAGGGAFETASSTTLTVNSLITGAGNLAKQGAGTLIITANNSTTYSGATTVSAGTLEVNNTTGSGTGSGGVTVNGGTLAGSGSIAGSVTVTSGLINPGTAGGASIGNLSLTDVLLTGSNTPATRMTLQFGATGASTINDATGIQAAQAGGTLSAYLAGKAADYEAESGLYDKVTLTGVLSLNAGGRISLDNALGYTFAFGDVFDLMDWSSIANLDGDGVGGFGAFDPNTDMLFPTLGGELAFNTSLFASNGIIVVVPEPSRALFLLLGLLGLLMRRRRR